MKMRLCLVLCCASMFAQTPVVFVHGNGDDASKWLPVIWMFESNGYPKDKLFAIRFTDPSARRENSKAEPFRSSTTDQASELAGFVARVLIETKAQKVALVGSSRGGMTIRNYIKNGGGAAVVSHAVLCGTPNHGVVAMDGGADFEFNGKGDFLRQLNQGSEVVDGVKFLTLRSDKADKYAQPNVGYDGPALKGAENVVLPGLDHREVAFHPLAFAETYRFIVGKPAATTTVKPEASVTLSGVITGMGAGAPTNRPLSGVRVRVYVLKPGSAERDGAALLETTTSDNGVWGPLGNVNPERGYEFVLEKDGRAVTYFKSGLARSTGLMNFRFWSGGAMGGGTGKVVIHRPQGYLAKGRDDVTVDGKTVEGLPGGVPTRDSVVVPAATGGVRVVLRGEMIYARPAEKDTDLSIADLIWD